MKRTRSEFGFRRWAARLFDRQMWCFGRDIVQVRGNLLLDLGMCQYWAPDPKRSSSMYTAAVESGGNVFLWGFGAMYSEPGRGESFDGRYNFAPKLTARESALGVHESEHLGRLVNPMTASELIRYRTHVPRLVKWFAKYEHWVAESFGTTYREQCLAARNKANWVAPKDMARKWERAAKQAGRWSANTTAPVSPWCGVIEQLRTEVAVRATNGPAYRPPVRVS